MRVLLEKKFFPFVIKPGRYAGGEPGQIVKDPAGRVSYLHAYPDKYEVGQSYVGLQSLYHVVNADDRFLCERVFAVDIDAEEIMRREKIPLFSLESSRPAAGFDAIGFTLSFELVYTNMLTMLDLAGIPLLAKDRTDGHPLVLAGGPSAYNPEPLADFVDVFFIGDAEEGLPEVLSVLHALRGAPRRRKLEEIATKVPSAYVPAFYDAAHKPIVPFAPEIIRARHAEKLNADYYAAQPLVPLIDTVHDHLAVEIMRGCPQGCRFCMAGPIYRPVRVRPEHEILDQIETQIRNTGYAEVALMSLSTSDYPNIDRLATAVARRLESRRTAISLPTMRPGTISPALLDAVSRVRKSGLTIAPEAGTERLRLFVRKDFPDAAIYDTVRLAYARGWMTIKLYFMVGLPTETDQDLLGICDMVRNIADIRRDYPGKKSLNVTLSPFVPKPHTPFQWDAQEAPEEMLRRINFVKRHVRLNNVSFKHSSLESVVLQGVVGRGDRRLGAVIAAAWAKGCRFDSWSEHFQAEKWWEAFRENGVDIREVLKPIPFSTALPWSHISKGAPAEHLRQERERTSTALRDFVPLATNGGDAAAGEFQLEYGRGKKKVAVRNTSAPTRNRLRIRWGKNARYKYMSHLDNLRLVERLIRRSGIPVAYSQGFNPTMKLSLGPPLPLGYTSEAEYVDITLETNLMAYMVDNLRKAMPEGIILLDARPVAPSLQSLSAALNRVTYTLPLEQVSAGADSLDSGIAAILGAEVLEIDRVGKTETKKTDIRPGIYALCVEAGVLSMTLGIGEGGYVRPAEVMSLILKTRPEEIYTYAFHRKAVWRVDESGRTIDGMDV